MERTGSEELSRGRHGTQVDQLNWLLWAKRMLQRSRWGHGGGDLDYASDRQQGAPCVPGKDGPDGNKDAEQCTGWMGSVPKGFPVSRLKGLGRG